MNTSAINNPLPIQAASPSNGKQQADAASDSAAFNQVLSNEISNRNDSGANTAEVQKNNQKSGQKDAAGKDEQVKTEAGKNTDETKAADKDKTTSAADKKTDDDAAGSKATDSAAAGIIAFVAALTENRNAAAPAATAVDIKIDVADKLKGGIDKAVDASAPVIAAADDKDAIGKKQDFVSVLEKAGANTGEGGKALTAAQAAEVLMPMVATSAQIAAPAATALQRANEMQTMQANAFAQQVGSADWDKALGQKVVWMVQGAQHSATMTLNPPDLGPMQITLNVNNNQATANFTAHHPEVRHALENAMPRLREMLGEAGIQLGQSSVSAGSPNQQGAFEQSRQNGRDSSQIDAANEQPLHVSHVPTPSSPNGMVDTFA